MKLKILLSFVIAGTFFTGCGNDVRPDSYVSQPSVLLTRYNISHMRLHVNSKYSGVLTFAANTFTYDSAKKHYAGTWTSSEQPIIIDSGESVTVVNSIEYSTDEGFNFTTYFYSGTFTLDIGDDFIMTGDQILSGTVTQIELNNL